MNSYYTIKRSVFPAKYPICIRLWWKNLYDGASINKIQSTAKPIQPLPANVLNKLYCQGKRCMRWAFNNIFKKGLKKGTKHKIRYEKKLLQQRFQMNCRTHKTASSNLWWWQKHVQLVNYKTTGNIKRIRTKGHISTSVNGTKASDVQTWRTRVFLMVGVSDESFPVVNRIRFPWLAS